jgi:mannose-6-phosphate isomerase-like protein (cupin superfamily)
MRLKHGRYAILYRFGKGEGLPEHLHCEEERHDITCTRGSVQVTIGDRPFVLKAGDYLVPPGSLPHEIVALEDDSCTLHEYVNGMPTGYDSLPASELDRDFTLEPLKHPMRIP